MPNFLNGGPSRFSSRLVRQGVNGLGWLLVFLLFSASNVQAQSDATGPAISLNAADGTTNFSSLPSPLAGEVFDAGGMNTGASGLLTLRLYRNRSGSWERWAQNGWVDIAAIDSHWVATVTPTNTNGIYRWSADVPWPTGANLPYGDYVLGVSAIDNAGNRTNIHRSVLIKAPDTTPPTVEVNGSSSAEEGARLPHLPRPLVGRVFDEGGMGGLLTVRVYRYRNGGYERWSDAGWVDIAAVDSHWTGTVVPSDQQNVYNWSVDVPWPTGANLPPDTYTIGVSAIDNAGNRTNVHRTFVVEEPKPTPALTLDAHIRSDAAQLWLGEGFSNATAQGQTLTDTIASGETQTRQIRIVRSGGADSQSVRVSLPDWAAFSGADWTARFYGAPTGGQDITAQITSNSGWSTVMVDGGSQMIRVEASAPWSFDAMGATGALTFRVEDGASDGSALDVVKAVWNVKAPTADLAIRAENAGAWLGQEVTNADGADQTLERVAKPGQTVKGQIKLAVANAAQGQSVRWSVPNWDAFTADGWQARFFDVAQDGNDITTQLTGEGWTTQHNAGYQPVIRFEATAPAGASDVTRVLGVRAQVGQGEADMVKLSLQVLPSAQPDVAISLIDKFGVPGDYTGAGELSPTEQKIATVLGASETQRFVLQITNVSQQTSAFKLALPTPEVGWQLKVYDALTGGTLLASGDDGITTPSIAAGQSLRWRVEVTASVPATRASLPLRVSGGEAFDEVELSAALQRLVGLQWSRDGETWTDVTATTKLQSERYQSLGFRALKAVPDVGWPNGIFGPNWRWQGAKVKGDKVWLSPRRVTDGAGEIATATLGSDSFGATIVVLPDVDLYLDAALGVISAGATVAVTIKARDENDAPLTNLRVRLRSTRNGADNGHFADQPSGKLFLLTDAQGNINTTWTAETAGRVQLSIEAVDGADAVFGEGDTWTMEVTG